MTEKEIEGILDIMRMVMSRAPDDEHRMKIAEMFIDMTAMAYDDTKRNGELQ
jgi:putative aminopeptidase FrvX